MKITEKQTKRTACNGRFGATAAVIPLFPKILNFVPYRLQTNKKCYLCR